MPPITLQTIRSRPRWVVAAIVLLLLIGLLAWRMGWLKGDDAGKAGQGAMPPVPVEVSTVLKKTVLDQLSVTGSFMAVESVDLRPEVAGRIAEIRFRDGQQVSRGMLLIRLDDSVVKAELAQAQAEAELALSNYRRAQDLFSRNFISSRALDEAKANSEIAAAKRDLFEARLQRTQISAPFAGRVGLRQHSPGDYVKDGEVVAVVEDTSRLYFDFRVPERYVGRVQAGQSVSIQTDQLREPIVARVTALDARVDAEGRFLQLRAVVPNPSGKLKSGLFARGRLVLTERAEALVISEEAIVGEQSGFFVWRVREGKVEKVPVQLGTRMETEVEILSGLAEGDQVVIAGQLKIRRPGQPAKVLPTPNAQGTPPAAKGPPPAAKASPPASP